MNNRPFRDILNAGEGVVISVKSYPSEELVDASIFKYNDTEGHSYSFSFEGVPWHPYFTLVFVSGLIQVIYQIESGSTEPPAYSPRMSWKRVLKNEPSIGITDAMFSLSNGLLLCQLYSSMLGSDDLVAIAYEAPFSTDYFPKYNPLTLVKLIRDS